MVKTKSAAVLYFLRVLTASFNVENERRKELFDYLEKENILPNIDHVAASIKEEIRQLCFKLKLEDHYPKIEKLWKELTSDNEYENFFREHYKSGDKIS
jgi:cytochrome oxidase Cu insertion factor (SCO1/SenC/PrrC family)